MLGKNISAGGKSSLTYEGNSRFLDTEGEIIFTSVFQDDDMMRVLETHHDFWSYAVVNCLVNNIILLGDEEKLDKMICLELNQFYGGAKCKVCNISFRLYL